MQSVAKHYNVAPQSLASANHISVDTPLHTDQVLNIPPPEYYTAVSDKAADKPQTPQQKTDAAAKAYQQAIKDREQAMRNAPHNMGIRSEILQEENAKVDKAQNTFNAAVQTEISGKVADATQGVPPEYRTSNTQLIKTYGDQIAARYAGDPDLQGRRANRGS